MCSLAAKRRPRNLIHFSDSAARAAEPAKAIREVSEEAVVEVVMAANLNSTPRQAIHRTRRCALRKAKTASPVATPGRAREGPPICDFGMSAFANRGAPAQSHADNQAFASQMVGRRHKAAKIVRRVPSHPMLAMAEPADVFPRP